MKQFLLANQKKNFKIQVCHYIILQYVIYIVWVSYESRSVKGFKQTRKLLTIICTWVPLSFWRLKIHSSIDSLQFLYLAFYPFSLRMFSFATWDQMSKQQTELTYGLKCCTSVLYEDLKWLLVLTIVWDQQGQVEKLANQRHHRNIVL